MKILVVAATKLELAPLLKQHGKYAAKSDIISFRFGKNSVDVLITGVGMTATAFHMGRVLRKRYDLAINAGVAGSFRKGLAPGEVVNVVSDRFSDMGVEDGDKFLTAAEMGLTGDTVFRAGGFKRLKKEMRAIPGVHGITVNTVHGNKESIRRAVRKFNPDTESMEGAAFFYACRQEGIPCVQVRAISNYVELRNRGRWKMELAVKNLNRFLAWFLHAL